MATVKKFEDLICWQKARELTQEVYRVMKAVSDYGFRDQIQRAAVSVMSNVAEGFERGTRQEFLNYLFIAKGSCGEVRNQLYVALDIGYVTVQKFNSLKRLSEDCSVLIWRLIQSLKVSEFSGLQYKQAKTKEQQERAAFDAQIREMVEEGRKEREQREGI